MKLVAAFTFGTVYAMAQTPAIDEIMSRVAGNQATSVEAERRFVYDQEELVRLHRSNGKLAREEKRRSTVAPGAAKDSIHLDVVEGEYADHGKLVKYDKPAEEHKGLDLDATLVKLAYEDEDEEGAIPRDLFPLTAKEQAKYDFKLQGVETYHARQVYRVHFEPKKPRAKGEDHGAWKGDALIDAEEFQPVMVSTSLAWKMPMAVKILLGTNIRGLGFSVTYQRFEGGVWFPVSYGGEFEITAAFFYKRTMSIALKNEHFRRTDVASTVAFENVGK